MKGRILNLPLFGRYAVVPDRFGSGALAADAAFSTNLTARVLRDGQAQPAHRVMNLSWLDYHRFGQDSLIDLGSGLVTNVGVMAMSDDWNLAAPSGAAINILKLSNNHVTGTGTTAAAATDIKLQTLSVNGGQTPVAGTQTTVTAANLQKYQTVATISYTGTEAVTEWGLISATTTSATTGTPLTAVSATSATATGTPFTASSSTVQGQQQHIIATGTTTVWGYITSSTTSVLSLANNGTTGWWKVSDGTAGSTPGSTEAYTLYPILWDHKVFSAINVLNGDSIQFTYQLQIQSGG